MKKLRITFVDENVAATAVLLEDKAPATCNCIWNALEQRPAEAMGIHAMWTGREISVPFPGDLFPKDEGLSLPPENQITIPLPGDIVWNAYAPYQWQGNPNIVYDFGVFYGRDSRLLLPMGWKPSSLFARIEENLDAFAAVCARCQREGLKKMRIERAL